MEINESTSKVQKILGSDKSRGSQHPKENTTKPNQTPKEKPPQAMLVSGSGKVIFINEWKKKTYFESNPP